MEIVYDGKTYDLDFDEVTLKQASVIKNYCHLSLGGLQAGLAEGDADALRALFWLMQVNSGVRIDIKDVDFKIVKFANAVQEAGEKESERVAAELKSVADKAKNKPVEDVPLPEVAEVPADVVVVPEPVAVKAAPAPTRGRKAAAK